MSAFAPLASNSVSALPHHRCWKNFREAAKINGAALGQAGFARWEEGGVGAQTPGSSPRPAGLSRGSPRHPARPVMSCITCSAVGMSRVTGLCSILEGEALCASLRCSELKRCAASGADEDGASLEKSV